MPETVERVVIGHLYGKTLPNIVWKRFRRPMPGVVERTLERNPGLAALGPILPLGTEILLVIPGSEETEKPAAVLRLWGVSS